MKYFEIFGMKPKFLLEAVERQKIENQHLALQKEAQSGVINFRANAINEAYAILKDDAKRAEYILKNLNINIEEYKMPQDLVEYIMDIREDIVESEEESEIQGKVVDVELELEEAKDAFSIELDKCDEGVSQELKIRIAVCFMRFKALYEIVKKYKKARF